MTPPPPAFLSCVPWWSVPFRSWPHAQLRDILCIISDLYSSKAGFLVRVASWQKLAWIADPVLGPRANPSPSSLCEACILEAVGPWTSLLFFCDKTIKHFQCHPNTASEFNLFGLHSSFCLTSWNCTSLRVTRDNSWKFAYIRRRCRHGLVLVQEMQRSVFCGVFGKLGAGFPQPCLLHTAQWGIWWISVFCPRAAWISCALVAPDRS